MNTQKFFSILGESFLNALVFLLIFNGFTAWVYHVNYFGAWEHSVSFVIGYFSGVFGYNIFKAIKDTEPGKLQQRSWNKIRGRFFIPQTGILLSAAYRRFQIQPV